MHPHEREIQTRVTNAFNLSSFAIDACTTKRFIVTISIQSCKHNETTAGINVNSVASNEPFSNEGERPPPTFDFFFVSLVFALFIMRIKRNSY